MMTESQVRYMIWLVRLFQAVVITAIFFLMHALPVVVISLTCGLVMFSAAVYQNSLEHVYYDSDNVVKHLILNMIYGFGLMILAAMAARALGLV